MNFYRHRNVGVVLSTDASLNVFRMGKGLCPSPLFTLPLVKKNKRSQVTEICEVLLMVFVLYVPPPFKFLATPLSSCVELGSS